MKIIPPSHRILALPDKGAVLKMLERIGRTCYKSEDKMTPDSARDFVKRCDRGISHELVRHRLASFSQESTRYANYSKDKFGKEITVIRPYFWDRSSDLYSVWRQAMEQAEEKYLHLIGLGARPEEARTVLPNSLKTELIMTCNLREWRHIFDLRCSRAAHPQMRELLFPLLDELHERIPVVFDDLYEKYAADLCEWPRRGNEGRL
ncbi:MAG: thymidylate synthase, flavin-dependent [Deltaproteobacteria bacterium]|nr:thymidylate synthase, flavin-dependent [Deltaproteobacteria bacterium]